MSSTAFDGFEQTPSTFEHAVVRHVDTADCGRVLERAPAPLPVQPNGEQFGKKAGHDTDVLTRRLELRSAPGIGRPQVRSRQDGSSPDGPQRSGR